jgi:SAM-dependent methyltransferase
MGQAIRSAPVIKAELCIAECRKLIVEQEKLLAEFRGDSEELRLIHVSLRTLKDLQAEMEKRREELLKELTTENDDDDPLQRPPTGRKTRAMDVCAQEIIAGLAGKDFEALRSKFPRSVYAKYLDLQKFVPVSVGFCEEAGLIGEFPQRILDIGCGTGLFLYCARYFGHDGVGTDVETGLMAEMAAMLGVPRTIEAVRPFVPMRTSEQFDLVTALGTKFNNASATDGSRWRCAEWHYFLSDVEQHLTEDGHVFLRINRGERARAEGALSYDPDLQAALAPGHLHGIAYRFDRQGLRRAIENLNSATDSVAKSA